MTMVAKKQSSLRSRSGQAAIEMALSLPFVIWLIFYTLNAFFSIQTAHVAQKYAAMNMYERLSNRAQFSVDNVADQVTASSYIAVQYRDMQGRVPQRKILVGPLNINAVVGVCREPECK